MKNYSLSLILLILSAFCFNQRTEALDYSRIAQSAGTGFVLSAGCATAVNCIVHGTKYYETDAEKAEYARIHREVVMPTFVYGGLLLSALAYYEKFNIFAR